MACHSYNVIRDDGKKIKIASIDTMLSFYLAFLYASRDYYDKDRITCLALYLFKVQQENRLKQKGLLRRFSINCYGKQLTLEDMRAEKAKKFEELKDKRGTREYEEYFLRYRPVDKDGNITKNGNKNKNKTQKNKTQKRKKTKSTRNKQGRKKGKGTVKKRGRGGLWM